MRGSPAAEFWAEFRTNKVALIAESAEAPPPSRAAPPARPGTPGR